MKCKFFGIVLLSLAACVLPYCLSSLGNEGPVDGFLGLSKEDVHSKLGLPKYYYLEEIPYRRYWLFPVEDIKEMEPKFWADPSVPKDEVYPVERSGKKLLYRYEYGRDKRSASQPVERVKRYRVYLKDSPVELSQLASIVPEFSPGLNPNVLTFQQRQVNTNRILITFLLPEASEQASLIGNNFTNPERDYEWSLSYQVILCEGEEDASLKSKVCEVVIGPESKKRMLRLKKPLSIKEIINPFSS